MRIDEALTLLGLSNEPHKPIEIDKAYLNHSRKHAFPESILTANQLTEERNPYIEIETDSSTIDTIAIWDSLMLEWVYLSEDEVETLTTRELYNLRRERLWSNRSADLKTALEIDFPNRISYEWESETLFDDVDTLILLERMKADAEDELLSDTITRARIARARFCAIFIDPTLIWIEGTKLEKKDNENLYRPCYSVEVQDAFFRISNMYGHCGLLNAFRIMVLQAGLCFDEQGCILGSFIGDFQLTNDDIRHVLCSIGESQRGYGYPLCKTHYDVQLLINEENRYPICFMPKSLREAVLRDGSVLAKKFSNERDFRTALMYRLMYLKQTMNIDPHYAHKRKNTENAIRAICELDGENPEQFEISKEALGPTDEAYECIMNEPWRMMSKISFESQKRLNSEFATYKESGEKHYETYEDWKHGQQLSAFKRIALTLMSFVVWAISAGVITAIAAPLFCVVFSGMVMQDFEAAFFPFYYIVVGMMLFLGLFGAVWDRFSWPINLWWDKRIKKIPNQISWALDLSLIGKSLLALIIGGVTGALATGLLVVFFKIEQLNSAESLRIPIVVFAVVACMYNLISHRPKNCHSSIGQKQEENDAIRSEWEKQIANHIAFVFPCLDVETNNRSIIKSRNKPSEYYEIDIWIPELKLGIETNGEQYHDHAAYNRDKRNGTTYSREMYKEEYCASRGIKLIHVWSSENMDEILDRIDCEIKKRMVT